MGAIIFIVIMVIVFNSLKKKQAAQGGATATRSSRAQSSRDFKPTISRPKNNRPQRQGTQQSFELPKMEPQLMQPAQPMGAALNAKPQAGLDKGSARQQRKGRREQRKLTQQAYAGSQFKFYQRTGNEILLNGEPYKGD